MVCWRTWAPPFWCPPPNWAAIPSRAKLPLCAGVSRGFNGPSPRKVNFCFSWASHAAFYADGRSSFSECESFQRCFPLSSFFFFCFALFSSGRFRSFSRAKQSVFSPPGLEGSKSQSPLRHQFRHRRIVHSSDSSPTHPRWKLVFIRPRPF